MNPRTNNPPVYSHLHCCDDQFSSHVPRRISPLPPPPSPSAALLPNLSKKPTQINVAYACEGTDHQIERRPGSVPFVVKRRVPGRRRALGPLVMRKAPDSRVGPGPLVIPLLQQAQQRGRDPVPVPGAADHFADDGGTPQTLLEHELGEEVLSC